MKFESWGSFCPERDELKTCQWNIKKKHVFVVITLQWRHNGRYGVSNHQPNDCLLKIYSVADQRKHQSSASLAFVWGIHLWPVNSPHKWPVTQKMFPFDDVIMIMHVGGVAAQGVRLSADTMLTVFVLHVGPSGGGGPSLQWLIDWLCIKDGDGCEGKPCFKFLLEFFFGSISK